jgi:flagellar basal-body rod protein FlgG
MDRALWVAKTGLDAQQTRLAVISNNMANVSTNGFKRARPVFEDLVYQNIRQVGAQSTQNTQLPSGLYLGTGVNTVATEKQHTQGNLVNTGNALDVAIEGRGYFQVTMPDGSLAYTRDGAFQLDSQGQVVTASGDPVAPAMSIPADALSVTIGADGTISAMVPGTPTPTQIGNIQLADFVNPAGLQPLGKNLFAESASSGAPQVNTPGTSGAGTVLQGFTESSNVNVVEELVNMIEAQRAYEMNSKAIQTSDQMLQFITQTL